MTESVTPEGHAANRPIWPVIVSGCVAVLIIDTGGSLISRATGLSYGYFALLSFPLYVTVGVIAAMRGSLASSAWAGLSIALFDATVGWWISWQIGPGQVELSKPYQFLIALLTLKLIVAAETLLALGAGAGCRALRSRM